MRFQNYKFSFLIYSWFNINIQENYENDHNIEMTDATIKDNIFIERCSNCTIKVKGKVKTVIISNCASVGLMIEVR